MSKTQKQTAKTEVAVFDTKPYDLQYLTAAGRDRHIVWKFHEAHLTLETAVLANGARAVCIFVNDVANRPCLEKLASSGVKLIALRCAVFNNVDLAAATAVGMAVVRVPAYSPHAVAEHAIGLLLCLNRKIHRAFNRVREHNFALSGLIGFDIFGKTVGIIGTGKIGKVAAEIFRGFNTKVLAYDPFPAADWAKANKVTYVDMEDLLAQCDIISLHLPLSPETHHLLNAKTLAQTKRGVYIINTSRGKLIDSRALIAGLKREHIGGVALDVYEEEEKLFFEDRSGLVLHDEELARLLTFPNVLITAHQAFLTHEGLSEIARVTVENICRYDRSEPFITGTTL
jgi:D-lactate dehydrogenase